MWCSILMAYLILDFIHFIWAFGFYQAYLCSTSFRNKELFELVEMCDVWVMHICMPNHYVLKLREPFFSEDSSSITTFWIERVNWLMIRGGNFYCEQLKIAYKPQGKFSLRDLHRALSNLPLDAFCPESNDSGALCKGNTVCFPLLHRIFLW